MSNKPRHSALEWSELINEYHESGETEQHFCRRHDLNVHTFRGWKYRQSSAPASRPKRVAPRSDFVSIVTSPQRSGEPLRIRCGEALSIDCPRDMALEDIARLAGALRDGC